MPCLITALAEAASARYMTVGGIYEAYQKEVKVWGLEDIKENLDLANIGLKGSPTKVKKSMTKEVKGEGELVKQEPKDAVTYVLGKLKEKHYI